MSVKGVILVGGPSLSTSFRPLNLNVPKPIFPIAGHPIVYHHVRALAQVPNLSQVLLIGTFEPELFTGFLEATSREFNVPIKYLREYEALGTGGGLYHFRDQIQRKNTEFIIVLHADVACSFPLVQMLDFHKKHQALVTVLATKVRPELTSNYGCIVVNPTTNEALHYVEKPATFVSDLISCGVYCFNAASIFHEMAELIAQKDRDDEMDVSAHDKIGLERDVLAPLASRGKLFVYETREFWQQLHTPSSAIPANRGYLEMYAKQQGALCGDTKSQAQPYEQVGHCHVHQTATVHPTAKIGPNVSIGAHCEIGPGARIKDSIILPNVTIEDNACVLNSIIGGDCRLGKWCRVEGILSTDNEAAVTLNGVKKSSVAILAGDNSVANEVVLRNCIVLPHKELNTSYANEIIM